MTISGLVLFDATALPPKRNSAGVGPGDQSPGQDWQIAWQREMEAAQMGDWFPGMLPTPARAPTAPPPTPETRPGARPSPIDHRAPLAVQDVPVRLRVSEARPQPNPETSREIADESSAALSDQLGMPQAPRPNPILGTASARTADAGLPHKYKDSRAQSAESTPKDTAVAGAPVANAAAAARGSSADRIDGPPASQPSEVAPSLSISAHPASAPTIPHEHVERPLTSSSASLKAPAPAVVEGVERTQALSVLPSRVVTSDTGHLPVQTIDVAKAPPWTSVAQRPPTSPAVDAAEPVDHATHPVLSKSIERLILRALALGDEPRMHLSVEGTEAHVWLGLNASPDLAGLLQTVQRVLRQQGLTLATLTCNGKGLFEAKAADRAGPGFTSKEF